MLKRVIYIYNYIIYFCGNRSDSAPHSWKLDNIVLKKNKNEIASLG